MRAALYVRKSTEQTGVADDQKSVTRQIEHARAYATRKGWTVDEACIFVDDGISGAEFANRPGFLRLMNALKPRPPFQALVMSEESRLGREAIETAYALKQIVNAGERTLDSPLTRSCCRLRRSRTNSSARRRDNARTMRCSVRRRQGRPRHRRARLRL
jgi:Resolvase, N terminal domain